MKALLRAGLIAFIFLTSQHAFAQSVDEHGHPFQSEFDFHDRFVLSSSYDFSSKAIAADFEFHVVFDVDFDREQIWWIFRNQFLHLSTFLPLFKDANQGIVLQIFEGRFLRHDLKSHILFPLHKDFRFPAPFDIAVEPKLGGFELDENGEFKRVRPFSIALLADFIRDKDARKRLALGPLLDYQIDQFDSQVRHRISPFTGVRAVHSWENNPGRLRYHLSIDSRYRLDLGKSEPNTSAWNTKGKLEMEWIFLAINDLPFSLTGQLEAEYENTFSWGAKLGLRVSYNPFNSNL